MIARLEAESDQGEPEDRGPRQRRRRAGNRAQGEIAAQLAGEQEEREEGEHGHVAVQQVEPTGPAHGGVVLLGGDEEEVGERHHLPRDQEGGAIARQQDEHQAREQQAIAETQPAAVARMAPRSPVSRAVDRAEAADQKDRHREQAAQAVGPELAAQTRERRGEAETSAGRAGEQSHRSGQPDERRRHGRRGGDARSPARAPAQQQSGQTAQRQQAAGGREQEKAG